MDAQRREIRVTTGSGNLPGTNISDIEARICRNNTNEALLVMMSFHS
jgi:hypothetical protein